MSEVSKSIGHAVLGPPLALLISKTIGYAVISAERNIVVSKAIAYAVLEEEVPEGGMPFVFIL